VWYILVVKTDRTIERINHLLDSHYAEHPHARPGLADLAIAAAELDGHPLADQPDLLRRAAAEIVTGHPGADADDVLLWAEAQAAASA